MSPRADTFHHRSRKFDPLHVSSSSYVPPQKYEVWPTPRLLEQLSSTTEVRSLTHSTSPRAVTFHHRSTKFDPLHIFSCSYVPPQKYEVRLTSRHPVQLRFTTEVRSLTHSTSPSCRYVSLKKYVHRHHLSHLLLHRSSADSQTVWLSLTKNLLFTVLLKLSNYTAYINY
jgi:hypothetical protein